MSKQANTTLVGAFVVGAAALLVAGTLFFGSGRFLGTKSKCVLFFEDSVKGLNVGAPVDFKGVKIGTVTDIRVILDEKDMSLKIPVYIELDTETVTTEAAVENLKSFSEKRGIHTLAEYLVGQGLRAQLQMQSFVTGQLMVHFDFYPDKPVRLVGADPDTPELPTIQSSLSELTKTIERLPVEDIAQKLLLTIDGLEKLVNSPDLAQTLAYIRETVKSARDLVTDLDTQVKPIAANVDKFLADARKLVKNVDDTVKPISADISRSFKDASTLLNNTNTHLPKLLIDIDDAFKAAGAAMKQAGKVIEGLGGENSAIRFELGKALNEVAGAARAIRVLAEYLERHPEALLQGKTGK